MQGHLSEPLLSFTLVGFSKLVLEDPLQNSSALPGEVTQIYMIPSLFVPDNLAPVGVCTSTPMPLSFYSLPDVCLLLIHEMFA
jgi:hypothetical protein